MMKIRTLLICVVIVGLSSLAALSASTFILFENPTPQEAATHFGVASRPEAITEEELPFLSLLLSNGQLARVAQQVQEGGAITDTESLHNRDKARLPNKVIDRLLVFYNLIDNR